VRRFMTRGKQKKRLLDAALHYRAGRDTRFDLLRMTQARSGFA